MSGLVAKWDAAVVGDNPPLLDLNLQEVPRLNRVQRLWQRFCIRFLYGDPYPPKPFDPASHPGCVELIKLNDGQRPDVIYRRA